MKVKMFLSQQFKSSWGQTATDAATKYVLPISLFFRYFRAKNPAIKKEH